MYSFNIRTQLFDPHHVWQRPFASELSPSAQKVRIQPSSWHHPSSSLRTGISSVQEGSLYGSGSMEKRMGLGGCTSSSPTIPWGISLLPQPRIWSKLIKENFTMFSYRNLWEGTTCILGGNLALFGCIVEGDGFLHTSTQGRIWP